eukprot:Sspe_Gene.107985::Locus_87138_Transcript_1_1_Confidence_1.000_Length_957::g.107985::m.107985
MFTIRPDCRYLMMCSGFITISRTMFVYFFSWLVQLTYSCTTSSCLISIVAIFSSSSLTSCSSFGRPLSVWNWRKLRHIMYSGSMSSTRSTFSTMLYVRWKELRSGSAWPEVMDLTTSGGTASSIIAMAIPFSSIPRRPARPLICTYSPEVSQRFPEPSNFLTLVKMTVLAGMLRPIAKVSVLKSTLMSCCWKRSSMTSFRMGRSPLWWIPTPRFSMGRMSVTAFSCLSSSPRASIALVNTSSTSSFSWSSLKSRRERFTAYNSHSFLEKENTMQGDNRFCMMTLMILVRGWVWSFPLRPFP